MLRSGAALGADLRGRGAGCVTIAVKHASGHAATAATVFGFDYCGFSRWVQARIEADGGMAAERITGQLNGALDRIGAGLAHAGLRVIETLGDGALAVADLDRPFSEDELDAIVSGAGLGLPFRRATEHGPIAHLLLAGRLPLWTGAGIERCHAAMREAPECAGGIAEPWHQGLAIGQLIDAEIIREMVGFVCVRGLAGAGDQLERAARTVDAATEAFGGILEKATHDEKGTLLRCHFGLGGGARDWAREAGEALAALGLDFGIGLAEGLVYRCMSADAPVVHGIAVNRAAKLAGAARGIAFAPDLAQLPAVSGTRVSRPDAALGRADEERALAAMLAGPRAAMDIVAEPGLGKTHLLARLNVHTTARLAHAAGRALSMYQPYRALRDWLATTAANPDDLALADPLETSGEAELLAWGDAIVAALGRAAGAQPIVFVLDDVQWTDRWSLDRLEQLRGIGHFVFARRPGGRPPPADHGLTLAPLPDPAIRALLGPAGADDGLLGLSAGNPFHALQLARALSEAVDLRNASDATAVVDARVRALDRTDRALLRLAAILARPASIELLAALAGRSALGFAPEQLARLVEGQFLRDDGGRFAVVHQLLSDRVVAMLPPSLVPQLHGHVARLLAGMRDGQDAIGRDEIASHWAAAGKPGRAALLYGQAGLHALDSGAHAAALAFLERANALSAPMPGGLGRRSLWVASRGLAAWGQGHVTLAAAAAREARQLLDVAPKARSPKARHRLSVARLRTSVAHAEAGQFRGDVRAIIRGHFGSIRWGKIDGDRSAARARGLVFVANSLGIARLGSLSQVVLRSIGRLDDSPRAKALVHTARAVLDLSFGRWAPADVQLQAATAELAHDPEPQLDEVVLTLAALRAHMAGDIDDAERRFMDLGARGRARGNDLIDAWGRYGTAMGLIARGEAAHARETIAHARALFDGLGDLQSELICYGMIAQAEALMGEDGRALATARGALALARQVRPTNFGALEGYSGPAVALAEIMARGGPAAHDAATLFPRARQQLVGYARVFPIGRARLAFAMARASGATRRMDVAALDAARRGMMMDARAMAAGGLWRTDR